MAKEFYTEGTGSNQVLHESPNEKIPVYDDLAAAEADLANLAVGQIGTTKDVGISSDIVEALKQYISDENELSAVEEVDMLSHNTPSTPLLVDYDGFMSFGFSTGNGWTGAVINGTTYQTSGNNGNFITLPIKKGDSVYTINYASLVNKTYARWYKKRHYGYR